MLDQVLEGSLIDLLSCVPNAQAFVVDIHVGFAIELHVELPGAVSGKESVGVGIHQARQDYFAGAVDALLEGDILLQYPRGDFLRCSDLLDNAFAVDCEGVAFEGSELGSRLHADEP